jgi:predicted O-methyltransferase YrrM
MIPELAPFVRIASKVPGWTRGRESEAMAQAAYDLPANAVIVEIGCFFGGASIVMAGARKLRGSGIVHCVDPFDGSGDPVSQPQYTAILVAFGGRPLQALFHENIDDAGLTEWVQAHAGTAEEIASGWSTPIDLLYLDGDQSPDSSRAAYDAWSPWLKPGGVVALHNSDPRDYDPGHDGHHRVAVESVQPPHYTNRMVVGSITFGRKAA